MDSLPKDILESSILTGQDLARLAGITELPNETEVNEHKLLELSDYFLAHSDNFEALETSLHRVAKELLKENKLEEAWMTLLSINH
jgi:hypothetical protein